MPEGTWVGLDVHARKVVAGVLDAVSGELRTLRAPTAVEEAAAWLGQLPAPVRVAYEAGPTGYGLARACAAVGIACTVAAPSKIPRAAGDKVKTDRRDAERLARLLRLGELVAVRVPEPHEEQARDLVRAREDARGELMRARHRLSKLLLRHGVVYDASAWTFAHDQWLRRQRFASRPLAIAFEESYAAVLQAKTRRDAFDDAIIALAAEPPFAEIVGRLVCLRGIATLTALALTVEIGDWQRFRPQSLGAFLGLTRVRTRRVSVAGSARSPRPATLTPAGCSSRRPGSSDDRCARARRSSDDGWDSRPPYAPALTRAQDGSTSAGTHSSDVANGVRSSRSRSRASSPDTAGHSRPCSQNQRRLRRGERSDERREERPAAQL